MNESLPPCTACTACPASTSRRDTLKALAGGAALALGLPAARADGDDAPRAGDWLVGVDDDAAKPLALADLQTGEKQLIAYPYDPSAKRARSGSRLNRILLIRLDPAGLDAQTAPRAAGGVLAYSAICTHQACDVNAWRAKEQVLLCFCHFSQFKPAEGGAVVAGPAPRPLPALPLKLDGERLVVAGGFNESPGAG